MYRTRAWRRHKDYVKAKRKSDIVHEQGDYWHYKYFGQYRKGKINCGCPMCRRKTHNRGIAAFYNGTYNYCPMDRKRLQAMEQDIQDNVNTP